MNENCNLWGIPQFGWMEIGIISSIERKLRASKSSGHRDTYVAIAERPNIARHLPIYFKVFNKADTDKGIFNEVFGFFGARRCGLPLPRDVFIGICQRNKLKGPAKCLQDRDPSEIYIPGVASIDSNPKKIDQIFDDIALYETELLNWPHLAQVAVYDELFFNIDRNAYNLVRVGKNMYVMIDHEHILGGTNWDLDKLETMLTGPTNCNCLASLIAHTDNEFITRKMLRVAQDYISRINFTADMIDMELHLESFCHLEKGSVEFIVDLLNKRKALLPELIFHHIKIGQMFYEQT